MALARDPEIDVFVELMGGEGDPAKAAIATALAARKSVVTANKALLARHGVALAALAEKNGVTLNFEAAVGGAIPIVKTLREGLTGNSLARIYGILNGTCNYILTRMQQETIAILGDYDVDGATSAAVLGRYLLHCGLRPIIHIPDRLFEGYGPNVEAVRSLAAQGATLLVAVDCGTTSHEPMLEARKLGLDVIVIDHHQADELLPAAIAVVNPNRLDDLSQLGHLAAVGLVFMKKSPSPQMAIGSRPEPLSASAAPTETPGPPPMPPPPSEPM